MNEDFFKIPKEVTQAADTLERAGYEAYLVGGCVRDLFLNRIPKDWDITTNATPEQIQSLFKETFYENDYGTVGVVSEGEVDPAVKVIEVTPYRVESGYSDNRHPDEVKFSSKLEDDLHRRDFTINAIALRKKGSEIEVVDLFEGKKDLQKEIIRTVGEPKERFNEDGLRIMRAVRIATELGFTIDPDVEKVISESGHLLKNISMERIRDEFVRIISSERAMQGLELCQKLNILSHFLPELEEGVGCEQNQAHSYDVFEHLLRTLDHAARKNFSLEVRLAALLHDIGKPATRRFSKEKNEFTFYGHDVVSEKMARKILLRMKFSNKIIETVCKLVRWHMFFSDTEVVTLSAVRRIVRNVGKENVWDLMNLRAADRIGTGRPKESPYRLRKYHSMIDEALRDPISVSQLKINGGRVIEITGLKPSPKIGFILQALLEEVLEDPSKNTVEYMEQRAGDLSKLDDKELEKLGKEARQKTKEEEEREIQKIREKHFVD